MPVKKYFSASIPVNTKITRFTQTVHFVGKNQIITTSRIQKISSRVTMNKLSTNDGLKSIFVDFNYCKHVKEDVIQKLP